MRRFLLVALLACFGLLGLRQYTIPMRTGAVASSGSAPVPGLVSDRSGNISRQNAIGATEYGCTADAYCIPYVYPAAAGDLGIVAFTSGTSTPTVSDDKTSTYTCIAAVEDTASTTYAKACYSTALAASAHYATVGGFTAADTKASAKAADFYNTGALDTSATNASATASLTMNAGSITPSSGDLLYVYICRTGQTKGTTTGGTFTPATQTGVTWNLLTTDSIDGCMDMWGIWSGTGSINPQISSSTSTTYAGLVLAFKAAASPTGTAPSGMYISKIQSAMTPTVSNGPYSEQFATQGNLAVFEVAGGTPIYVSSITDSNRTWSGIAEPTVYPNTADYMSDSAWYAPNIAADATGTMTVNTAAGGSNGDVSGWWFDIVGAAASPLGNYISYLNTNDTGTGTTLAVIPSFVAFQPGISSGLVLAYGGLSKNTATGLSAPVSGYFAAAMACTALSGPCSVDQNNFVSFVPVSSNASLAFTANLASNTQNVVQHGAHAIAFLANGAATATGQAFAANECVDPTTSEATYTCKFKAAHTGDIIAVAYIGPATTGTVSASDTCTNTWTPLDGPIFPNGNDIGSFYAVAKNTSECTLTLTWSAAAGVFHAMYISDLQGVTTLDQHNAATVTSGTAGAVTGTSVTTTHANEIAWSYGVSWMSFANGATGNWQFMDDNNGNGQEWQILTATGSIAGQYTDSGGSGHPEGVGIATFY